MFVYVSRAQQIFNTGYNASRKGSFATKARTASLIRWDREGEWIYAAGKEWAKFDYEAGFDALLKLSGRWIVEAARHWPRGFDYAKAKAEFERRNDTYWLGQLPKGAKETVEAGEEIKKTATKMEKKPFGLKEGRRFRTIKEAIQFQSSIEGQGKTRVLINPSIEEMDNIAMSAKWIRGMEMRTLHFIFDAAKRNFYVFSPNEYHSRVMVELGLSTLRQNTGDYPQGKLVKKNNQWKIESIKGVTQENYKKVENYIKNKYLK
jgi:hypothetical protein